MCKGFGVIVDKELNVWFCEPDKDDNCSHSIILERLGWRDNTDQFKRNFVRVQYPDWTPESFEFDENATLPAWAEENKQEIIHMCNRVLERVSPAWTEYDKVCGAARAECDKVRGAARAERNKVCDAAWAEHYKVCDAAWAECAQVCGAARAECDKVRGAALEKFTQAISSIPGFVGE